MCSRVLQHVSRWKDAIAEQARVLKPGGDLLLLLYNRFSPYGMKKLVDNIKDPKKGNFRNPIDIRMQLRKNGLNPLYHSGAILSPLDHFPKDLSEGQEKFARRVEQLAGISPFKFFGARQVILARKES